MSSALNDISEPKTFSYNIDKVIPLPFEHVPTKSQKSKDNFRAKV